MNPNATKKPQDQDPNDRYGAIIAPGTIRFERLLPGPLERVWSYLTEPEKTALWIASGTIDLRVGGKCEWHCDYGLDQAPGSEAQNEAPVVYGEILELDPPRLFRAIWDASECSHTSQDGTITEITYELIPHGEQVRLVLTHSRLPNIKDIRSALAGWHLHLDILVDVLNGRTPPPFWETHEKLERVYQDLIRGE